jgi:hypothetical protein
MSEQRRPEDEEMTDVTPMSTPMVKKRSPLNLKHSHSSPALGQNGSSSQPTRISPDKLAEISASLKTRLSYAFVKVQKGWTTQSLDEIESLQQGLESPRGSPTKLHHYYHQQQQQQQQQEQQSSPSKASIRHLASAKVAKQHHRTHSDSKISSPLVNQQFRTPQTPGENSRRSQHRPSISLTTDSDSPHGMLSSPSPRWQRSEEDAVESLMFLSSPRAIQSAKFSEIPKDKQ